MVKFEILAYHRAAQIDNPSRIALQGAHLGKVDKELMPERLEDKLGSLDSPYSSHHRSYVFKKITGKLHRLP